MINSTCCMRSMTIRTDSVGLLLRSALIVEVATLIELSIGLPAGKALNRRDGTLLIALLRRASPSPSKTAGTDPLVMRD